MATQTWLMFDSKWISDHAAPHPPRGKFEFRAYVPRKLAEPVMVADKPWESMSLGWHTLHFDGGRYRMWYEAWDDTYKSDFEGRLCYAESDDCLHWRKPELGLVEFRGSKQNNIIFEGRMGFDLGFHGHSVCSDPTARAEERYRLIYMGSAQNLSGKVWIPLMMTAHSADGIRWQRRKHAAWGEYPSPMLSYASDTQTVAFWDPGLKKYVGFFRSWERGYRANPTGVGRCIARAETDDFDRWPVPVTVRTPDEADGPDTDLYNNAACRYESGGDVAYLIFTSTFNHKTDQCDVELATSRDSVSWQRLSRAKVITLGGAGAWDGGMIFASPTLVPFRGGLALSYNGHRHKHAETTPDKVRYAGGVGLVEYPRDRFQGLWSEELEATVCSFAPSDSPPRLSINAVIEPGGEIRGALTKDGAALPGCGFDDCAPVNGDVLAGALSWKGSTKAARQPAELRLRLHKATLYAVEAETG